MSTEKKVVRKAVVYRRGSHLVVTGSHEETKAFGQCVFEVEEPTDELARDRLREKASQRGLSVKGLKDD